MSAVSAVNVENKALNLYYVMTEGHLVTHVFMSSRLYNDEIVRIKVAEIEAESIRFSDAMFHVRINHWKESSEITTMTYDEAVTFIENNISLYFKQEEEEIK